MGNRGVVVFTQIKDVKPTDFVVEFFWQANWDDIQKTLDAMPEEIKPEEFVERFAFQAWILWGGGEHWENRDHNYNYKHNMTCCLTAFNCSYADNIDNGIYVVDPVTRKIVGRTFIKSYNPDLHTIIHHDPERLTSMNSAWQIRANQMRKNRRKAKKIADENEQRSQTIS